MYRSCPYCGRIHPAGYKCPAGKRVYKDTEESKMRSTSAWTKKSLEIRDKAQGLCEVCRAEGRYTYKGLEVHHIEKVSKHPELLLDNYNLIALCVSCHKKADRGEISKSYLRDLARLREEGKTSPLPDENKS